MRLSYVEKQVQALPLTRVSQCTEAGRLSGLRHRPVEVVNFASHASHLSLFFGNVVNAKTVAAQC